MDEDFFQRVTSDSINYTTYKVPKRDDFESFEKKNYLLQLQFI